MLLPRGLYTRLFPLPELFLSEVGTYLSLPKAPFLHSSLTGHPLTKAF